MGIVLRVRREDVELGMCACEQRDHHGCRQANYM